DGLHGDHGARGLEVGERQRITLGGARQLGALRVDGLVYNEAYRMGPDRGIIHAFGGPPDGHHVSGIEDLATLRKRHCHHELWKGDGGARPWRRWHRAVLEVWMYCTGCAHRCSPCVIRQGCTRWDIEVSPRPGLQLRYFTNNFS